LQAGEGKGIKAAPNEARLVIVGAGFAGSSLLRNLPAPLRRPGETILVDRANEHAFIPLIHEVAVGRIHPDTVRLPISPAADASYDFLRAEATGVDLEKKVLHTSSGDVSYGYLVLAPGSVAAPPPESLRERFQTFWSLDDALKLRGTLKEAWRHALRRERRDGGLTVAIVGGGATGVELAAEVAVLFDYLKKRTVRTPVEEPRVVLFEATDRLMGWLDPFFHRVAMEELSRRGVEVRLNAPVRDAHDSGVLSGGEKLPAGVRVWATGVRAAPLVRELPGEHDEGGRARVTEHLTLPDHPEVYALGDGSLYEDPRLGPLVPVASLAVQQGPWVARDLQRRLRGASSRRGRPPFRFFDRGYAVSLGPESGAAVALGAKLRGSAAQALYRSIFLYYMKSRRGRLLAGADWAMERVGRVGFDAQEPDRARGDSERR
jgi:NADH dehydrogenase